MICPNCSKVHENPKFCSRSCSASFNNKKDPKRGRRTLHPCKECNTLTKNSIFCSYLCTKQWQYEDKVQRWKRGELSGGNGFDLVYEFVRRYLREQRGNACEICGWNEIHPITGKVPLTVHHVGSCDDHSEANLQLLCPNHHSLTPTFGGLNRGKGRKLRPGKRLGK